MTTAMPSTIIFPVMTPVVMNPRLLELEADIERGKQAFVEVAAAIVEIRRDRLYRDRGYETFEAYLKERWGWSRQTGYQYIAAAKVNENVKSTLHSIPPSLTQAVKLAALPLEQQREVASKVDFSVTTTKQVSKIVHEVKAGKPAETTVEPNVTKRDAKLASRYTSKLEQVMTRLVRNYEKHSNTRVQIEVTHDHTGKARVKIIGWEEKA